MNLMKPTDRRCRTPRYLWALLVLMLLSPSAALSARAAAAAAGGAGDDADAEGAEAQKAEAAAKAGAEAKIRAAQTPVDKIIAFYERSRLPGKMRAPAWGDWTQAEADIDEALRLVAAYEADGKRRINGKENIFFEQGYIAVQLAKYPEAIAAYDLAEQAGYLKGQTASEAKGSELYNNRGQAKAALLNYSGALNDYDAALALYDGAKWRQNRAWAYYNLGNYPLAVSDWNRAAALSFATGKLPFDADQAPLNKAVAFDPGAAAPLIARARYLFKKALANQPDASEAPGGFFEDDDSRKANRMAPALADLDRAVANEPDSPVPWIERGRVRLAYLPLKSDLARLAFAPAEIEKDFLRAISLDPKSAEAWFELGLTHLELWRREAGGILAFVGREKEKADRSDAAMQRAIAAFSRAIYLQPAASGAAHFRRAGALRERTGAQDPHALLADYSAAIAQNLSATDPEWETFLHPTADQARRAAALAEAHLTRARILMSFGQLAATQADLEAALARQDGNLDARFERGKFRVRRGDYDGALADLERVIQGRPAVAEGWLWHGVAHDGKGETEPARADFAEAIKRDSKLGGAVAGSRYDPQTPNPARGLAPTPVTADVKIRPPGTALEHKNAGNTLRAKGDLDGALQEFNLALMIDPDFTDALNNRGVVYQIRGEVELALADLDHAIAIDPKHRVAYFSRGQLWRQLGETERERADFDRAVEFAETDERRAGVLLERARTRQAAKDNDGAMDDARRATELMLKNADAWRQRGTIELNAGHPAEAGTSYHRALEIDPDKREVRALLAVALALHDDPAASTELETALAMGKAAQLEAVRGVVNRAWRLRPDSAGLKALKDRADAAKAAE